MTGREGWNLRLDTVKDSSYRLSQLISSKDFVMTEINAVSVTQPGTVHTLAGSGDTLIIARNIRIESTAAITVLVSGGGNGIVNSGTISSTSNDGVSLGGDVNAFANYGIVNAFDDGVSVFGTQSTIYNSGVISAAYGLYFYGDSMLHAESTNVINEGTIAGTTRAISHDLDEDITIGNGSTGLIINTSNLPAIVSFSATSEMSLINKGRIVGDVAMGGGSDTYDGRGGAVIGDILGEAQNDRFIAGASAERFFGGADNDTLIFNSAGGVTASLDNTLVGTRGAAGDFYDDIENVVGSATGADVLRGSEDENDLTGRGGNDTLRGMDGSDVLFGNAGEDRMFGGTGIDFLYGGTGLDVLTGGADTEDFFYCRDLASAGDRITDFGNTAGNNDKFLILNTAVAGSGLPLGAVGTGRFITRTDNLAQQANDQFILRTTDNTLWYDANGSAAGGRTLLFDLQAGATMTANDIIIYGIFM
jgi:Ca2+-binding RTX toxin-like protein